MGEGVGSAGELNCVPNPCSQLARGEVGSVHKGVALHEISLSLWCLAACAITIFHQGRKDAVGRLLPQPTTLCSVSLTWFLHANINVSSPSP